jgi:hypothetical protein
MVFQTLIILHMARLNVAVVGRGGASAWHGKLAVLQQARRVEPAGVGSSVSAAPAAASWHQPEIAIHFGILSPDEKDHSFATLSGKS